MDQHTLGNVLFLSSLAGLSIGCAAGSEGSGPRPGPFMTSLGDDGGAGDPWTDPIETTGAGGTSGGQDDDGDGGWPSEGETGVVSSDTGELPPEDDDGPMGGSSSGGMPPGGESGDEGGDEGGGDTTGYGPMGGDPCPALAQLYTDCNPDYTYESEIQLCNQSRANAASISAACGIAHAEYLACLSTVDCATLLSPDIPFACVLQAAATDLACLL